MIEVGGDRELRSWNELKEHNVCTILIRGTLGQ
jgi:hypothetical protein